MLRRISEYFEGAPEVLCLAVLVSTWLVFVVVSVLLSGDGFIHPEIYSFLPHYLSGRPFLELIYDNRVTDWGNYQARELAFVFDWLDCQFIRSCVQHGRPHLFSVTHYIFFLLAGIALWRICTRYLKLQRSVSFALVLLLWSSPTAVLYTSFYRSAKVGSLLSVFLVIWAWLAARERLQRDNSLLALFLVSLTAALMPMFDKQGLIFLVWFVALLAQQAIVHRNSREWRLLAAGVAALISAWIYQKHLGPWLAWKLDGIQLDLQYATVPFAKLANDFGLVTRVISGSPIMALDSFRIPLGNLPLGIALLALWWVWRQFFTLRTPLPGSPYRQLVLSEGSWFAMLCLGSCGLFAVMLMLFPQMLSSEHRRLFYPLPLNAVWLSCVAATSAIYIKRFPDRKHWLPIVAWILVISNLFALQEHRFVFRHGKYREFRENASRLVHALKPGELEKTGITREEAATLLQSKTAPWLSDVAYRDEVPATLREDRLFLVFRSQM